MTANWLRPSSRTCLAALLFLLAVSMADSAPGNTWRASEARIVLSLGLDGSMLVRETFTIAADTTHDTPWRDLPLRVVGAQDHDMDIEILQLSHAKQALSFDSEVVGNRLRVHFGSAKRRIAPGRRTYELLYHVDAHLLVNGGREWLAWRPLGPGLAAIVDDLELTLTFPRSIETDDIRVHSTGLSSSESKQIQVAPDSTVSMTWKEPLGKDFGPGILVSWPRGYLLTATDSDIEPWFAPRPTSLYMAVATLAPLAVFAWLAGCWHSRLRRALPVISIIISLASLYASGAMAARYPEWFAAQFLMAIATIGSVIVFRHWLTHRRLRIAYVLTAVLLISVVTYLLVHNLSAWFVVLLLAHTDFVILAWWRSYRRAHDAKRRPRPESHAPPPRHRETQRQVRNKPRAPLLQEDELLDHTRQPDGRRTPYFAGSANEPTRHDSDRGLNPPPADDTPRTDAFEPRPGRTRKY